MKRRAVFISAALLAGGVAVASTILPADAAQTAVTAGVAAAKIVGSKMGPETDNGTWKNSYSMQFPFSISGKQYFYGQNQDGQNWFIQELLPGGKMGVETDHGRWNNAYAVQFPFSVGGKQYFYGQNLNNKYWFIQELLPDGKMGAETASGFLDATYRVQFPFTMNGRQYFYGQDLATNRWFIRELLLDGKMGEKTSDGTLDTSYESQFPFSVQGRHYFYGQDLDTNRWVIRELLSGGKMGNATDQGTWANPYAVQFPFVIGGKQFFYGQNQGGKNWFIQELLPDGKMGVETDHGRWNNAYGSQFPFAVGGKQYFYGQNLDSKYWFLQELVGPGMPDPGPDPDAVTVNIWSFRGKYAAWGHASMQLNDGTYISWWPSRNPRDRSWINSDIYSAPAIDPQTYANDVNYEGQDPDIVLRVGGLNNAEIRRWWLSFKTTHDWRTLTQNCSTTVFDGLVAGGAWRILTQREHDNFSSVIVWTPSDIEQFATTIQAHR